jgi:hypothetical protein
MAASQNHGPDPITRPGAPYYNEWVPNPFRDDDERRLDRLRAENAELRTRLADLEAAALADKMERPFRRWGDTREQARTTKLETLALAVALLLVSAWLIHVRASRSPCPPGAKCFDLSPFHIGPR